MNGIWNRYPNNPQTHIFVTTSYSDNPDHDNAYPGDAAYAWGTAHRDKDSAIAAIKESIAEQLNITASDVRLKQEVITTWDNKTKARTYSCRQTPDESYVINEVLLS